MTLNQHGRRVNVDKLEREGNGYVGRHTPDILKSSDPWFRGIDLSYGPDGGVFILDWSDTGECHDHTGVHRTSGRIYKVTYGDPSPVPPFDLRTKTDDELIALHAHDNEWFVRQARRELQRRLALNQDLGPVILKLRDLVFTTADPIQLCRIASTLGSLGSLRRSSLEHLMNFDHEAIRALAIRFAVDAMPLDDVNGPTARTVTVVEGYAMQFLPPGAQDSSPLVRLAVASALQRLPTLDRVTLAALLLSRSEDAGDHDQPLMIWYGISPLAESAPEELADLLDACQFPLVRQFISRALAEQLDRSPRAMNRLLYIARKKPADVQRDVILGLSTGLEGWRRATPPSQWAAFLAAASKSADDATRLKLDELRALFGDGRALDELRKLALNNSADMNRRLSALKSLIEQKDPELRTVCEKLLEVRFLNTHAARGLTAFDDPAIGEALVKAYRKFHPTERPAIVDALVSRPSFAPALLVELEKGRIARSDLSASQARQIVNLGNAELTERLTRVWGDLRESSQESQAEIARWKSALTPEVLAAADKGKGRLVFARVCGNCHRLHGQGAEIGPDLTGAGRHNIDYLLGNILAPADVVPVDYRLSIVALTDGRVVSGIKVAETDRTTTLQTATARMTVEKPRSNRSGPRICPSCPMVCSKRCPMTTFRTSSPTCSIPRRCRCPREQRPSTSQGRVRPRQGQRAAMLDQSHPHVHDVRMRRPRLDEAAAGLEERVGIVDREKLRGIKTQRLGPLEDLIINHRTGGIRRTIFAIGATGQDRDSIRAGMLINLAPILLQTDPQHPRVNEDRQHAINGGRAHPATARLDCSRSASCSRSNPRSGRTLPPRA